MHPPFQPFQVNTRGYHSNPEKLNTNHLVPFSGGKTSFRVSLRMYFRLPTANCHVQITEIENPQVRPCSPPIAFTQSHMTCGIPIVFTAFAVVGYGLHLLDALEPLVQKS